MLTREKFRGCIIGQCVGDALGMPVERQPPPVCQRYVKAWQSGHLEHAHRPPFALGQYTDDSQLMRELLISFVACEAFDPMDYARRIAKLRIAALITLAMRYAIANSTLRQCKVYMLPG